MSVCSQALIDHLVAGGGAEPAPAPGPAPSFSSSPLQAAVPVQAAVAQPVPAQLSPSPQLGMTEEEQMAIAMRESLRMAGADTGGGGEGGGAMTVSRQSRQGTEGSAMDPSHTFRTLVIAMLQGDATARQDLVQNFGDLGSKIHESPRLLYFLLDNAKMDKLNRVPENIVSLWMGYLRRAPSQPKLQELVVMEGQLGKQGSKKWEKTGWKMKWFVMTDSMLCYYNKLADKQKGQEPKKSIPLSAVIRLQSVESSTSGMESSFEIITEQDTPNWKVHAHISDDFGESQLYCSRWQSAIEEAVRGARDLDRAFVNAKPQSYWAEIGTQELAQVHLSLTTADAVRCLGADAQLQTPHEHVGGDGAPPSQRSAASADSFDPRDAPAERTDDPFAAVTPAEGAADLLEAPTAPEPAPAPGSSSNLIEDILGADISSGGGGGAGVQDANAALLKALSSEDPFGAISFQVEAPAGASGAPMQPMGAMPVMTPSPGMAQAQSGAVLMPVGAQAASPFDPPPPQQGLEAPPASSMPANPFRTEPAPQPAGGVAALNPFRSDGPQQPSPFEAPPAVSAPAQQGMGGTPQRLGTPPGIGGASMVQSQARGVDGAINGNLFDEQARKVRASLDRLARPRQPGAEQGTVRVQAPLANPFAAGAKPAAASPGAPNPFASLDNDAWSKAAEKTSTPPQAAPLAEAPVAPAPAPAPAVSPWDSMGKAAAAVRPRLNDPKECR